MLSRIQSFHISLNSTPLISSSTACILGLHVDCSWSFQHHVTTKCRAAFTRLRLLYPLRHILSIQQKLHLSHALVLSLFDYADTIYVPNLNKRLLSRIQRVQNSCLRFSFGIRKYDHITPSLIKSGWLNIHQRFILHLCCLTFNVLRSNTPPYLRDLLHLNHEFHSSPLPLTRSRDLLSFPSHRSLKFRASFSFTSAKYYNSLPSSIRSSPSLSAFRSAASLYIRSHFS